MRNIRIDISGTINNIYIIKIVIVFVRERLYLFLFYFEFVYILSYFFSSLTLFNRSII